MGFFVRKSFRSICCGRESVCERSENSTEQVIERAESFPLCATGCPLPVVSGVDRRPCRRVWMHCARIAPKLTTSSPSHLAISQGKLRGCVGRKRAKFTVAKCQKVAVFCDSLIAVEAQLPRPYSSKLLSCDQRWQGTLLIGLWCFSVGFS